MRVVQDIREAKAVRKAAGGRQSGSRKEGRASENQFLQPLGKAQEGPANMLLSEFYPNSSSRICYSAIHPLCRNVLLQFSLKVASVCLGSR